MTTAQRKSDLARQLLRVAFTVLPLAAGADKFFHLLADWDMYLSSAVVRLLPVEPTTFLRVAGAAEIALGLAMMTRWVRFAAYLASAWLVLIAINLVTSGMFYDVAARDLALAVGALALALLTEARAARASSPAP